MQYKNAFLVSAGRPPLGQMPFIVTPEGNVLGQSAAIMKYICKKRGKILLLVYLQNYALYYKHSKQMESWMEYY